MAVTEAFHDLNPGNGTETVPFQLMGLPLAPFHDLNPGNGTETGNKQRSRENG